MTTFVGRSAAFAVDILIVAVAFARFGIVYVASLLVMTTSPEAWDDGVAVAVVAPRMKREERMWKRIVVG